MKDSIYKLNLKDKTSVFVDHTGKSTACFVVKDHVAVDNKIIQDLVALSEELGKKDLRICLHNDRECKLHNMINLIYKKESNIPHKHINKSECYHIIKGILKISIFDEIGNVINELILDKNNTSIFRIGRNTFHSTEPLTEYVIFHETRSGPFSKNGDSILLNFV